MKANVETARTLTTMDNILSSLLRALCPWPTNTLRAQATAYSSIDIIDDGHTVISLRIVDDEIEGVEIYKPILSYIKLLTKIMGSVHLQDVMVKAARFADKYYN